MTREELLLAIGNIDDDLILRAREERKKKPKLWVTLGSVAACLVIALAAMPFMQAKKDTAKHEATTATGSTSHSASAEWFDSDAMGGEEEKATQDAVDGGEVMDDNAPEAGDGSGAMSEYCEELEREITLFSLNSATYRIVTDEDELKALGLTEEPSKELAGESMGEVEYYEDILGNAYVYTADMMETPGEVYQNAMSLENIYLLNHGDCWYYAVEETP